MSAGFFLLGVLIGIAVALIGLARELKAPGKPPARSNHAGKDVGK